MNRDRDDQFDFVGEPLRLPGQISESDLAARFATEPGEIPDLSAAILSRVGQQKPFASERVRTVRRWTRLVVGSFGVAIATAASIALIWTPELMPWSRPTHRPVTNLVSSAASSARASIDAIRATPARLEALAMSSAETPAVEQESNYARTWVGGAMPVASALGAAPSIKWPVGETARQSAAQSTGAVAGLFRAAERALGRASRPAASTSQSLLDDLAGPGQAGSWAPVFGAAVSGPH